MKDTKFLSTNINLKRVLKTLAIALPCTIMILVIGLYCFDLIDSSPREYYVGEHPEKILGTETTFEEEWNQDRLSELTKAFGIEEYIHNWDERLEDYYQEVSYIKEPKYYFSEETGSIYDSWILKDGYKLEVDCPEKKLSDVIPGYYYTCNVKYNGKLVSDDVRYYISYPNRGKSVPAEISMMVYSPTEYETLGDNDFDPYDSYEYMILASYYGGSFDYITVYSLEDGNAVKLPFYFNEEYQDRWLVEYHMNVSLYSDMKGVLKLVTVFHEPSMGPIGLRGVYRVWNIGKEALTLDRTFGNIIDYEKRL